MMPRMKKGLVIIVAIAAVLLAGGVWVYSTLDNQSTAKVGEKLTEFQSLKGPESDDPKRPAQGVYQYAVTGEEQIVRTGVNIDRTLPTTAVAIVYNLADGQYEIKTNFSNEHIELARYDNRPDGTHLTFAKTVLKIGPLGVTKDRVWTPTLIRNPANPKPGATTTGTYQAGETLTMKVTTTVLPPATVTVDGKKVPATVVKFDQVASGEFTGDRTETFYWSKDGMLLRYTIDSHLKGSTNLDFVADQVLTSLTPTE